MKKDKVIDRHPHMRAAKSRAETNKVIDLLREQADLRIQSGQVDEGIRLWKKVLSTCTEEYGKESLKYVGSCCELGDVCLGSGKLRECLTYYDEAVHVTQKVTTAKGGSKCPEDWASMHSLSLGNIAFYHYRRGGSKQTTLRTKCDHYQLASRYFEQQVNWLQLLHSDNSPILIDPLVNYAALLTRYGSCMQQKNLWYQAGKAFQQALLITKEHKDDSEVEKLQQKISQFEAKMQSFLSLYAAITIQKMYRGFRSRRKTRIRQSQAAVKKETLLAACVAAMTVGVVPTLRVWVHSQVKSKIFVGVVVNVNLGYSSHDPEMLIKDFDKYFLTSHIDESNTTPFLYTKITLSRNCITIDEDILLLHCEAPFTEADLSLSGTVRGLLLMDGSLSIQLSSVPLLKNDEFLSQLFINNEEQRLQQIDLTQGNAAVSIQCAFRQRSARNGVRCFKAKAATIASCVVVAVSGWYESKLTNLIKRVVRGYLDRLLLKHTYSAKQTADQLRNEAIAETTQSKSPHKHTSRQRKSIVVMKNLLEQEDTLNTEHRKRLQRAAATLIGVVGQGYIGRKIIYRNCCYRKQSIITTVNASLLIIVQTHCEIPHAKVIEKAGRGMISRGVANKLHQRQQDALQRMDYLAAITEQEKEIAKYERLYKISRFPTPEQTASSIKIQSLQRGRMGRQKAQNRLQNATSIQMFVRSWYSSFVVAHTVVDFDSYATRIQTSYKQRLARKEANHRRELIATAEEREQQYFQELKAEHQRGVSMTGNAVKIQAAERGRQERQRYHETKTSIQQEYRYAAVNIQKIAKGHSTRRMLSYVKPAALQEQRERKVTVDEQLRKCQEFSKLSIKLNHLNKTFVDNTQSTKNQGLAITGNIISQEDKLYINFIKQHIMEVHMFERNDVLKKYNEKRTSILNIVITKYIVLVKFQENDARDKITSLEYVKSFSDIVVTFEESYFDACNSEKKRIVNTKLLLQISENSSRQQLSQQELSNLLVITASNLPLINRLSEIQSNINLVVSTEEVARITIQATFKKDFLIFSDRLEQSCKEDIFPLEFGSLVVNPEMAERDILVRQQSYLFSSDVDLFSKMFLSLLNAQTTSKIHILVSEEVLARIGVVKENENVFFDVFKSDFWKTVRAQRNNNLERDRLLELERTAREEVVLIESIERSNASRESNYYKTKPTIDVAISRLCNSEQSSRREHEGMEAVTRHKDLIELEYSCRFIIFAVRYDEIQYNFKSQLSSLHESERSKRLSIINTEQVAGSYISEFIEQAERYIIEKREGQVRRFYVRRFASSTTVAEDINKLLLEVIMFEENSRNRIHIEQLFEDHNNSFEMIKSNEILRWISIKYEREICITLETPEWNSRSNILSEEKYAREVISLRSRDHYSAAEEAAICSRISRVIPQSSALATSTTTASIRDKQCLRRKPSIGLEIRVEERYKRDIMSRNEEAEISLISSSLKDCLPSVSLSGSVTKAVEDPFIVEITAEVVAREDIVVSYRKLFDLLSRQSQAFINNRYFELILRQETVQRNHQTSTETAQRNQLRQRCDSVLATIINYQQSILTDIYSTIESERHDREVVAMEEDISHTDFVKEHKSGILSIRVVASKLAEELRSERLTQEKKLVAHRHRVVELRDRVRHNKLQYNKLKPAKDHVKMSQPVNRVKKNNFLKENYSKADFLSPSHELWEMFGGDEQRPPFPLQGTDSEAIHQRTLPPLTRTGLDNLGIGIMSKWWDTVVVSSFLNPEEDLKKIPEITDVASRLTTLKLIVIQLWKCTSSDQVSIAAADFNQIVFLYVETYKRLCTSHSVISTMYCIDSTTPLSCAEMCSHLINFGSGMSHGGFQLFIARFRLISKVFLLMISGSSSVLRGVWNFMNVTNQSSKPILIGDLCDTIVEYAELISTKTSTAVFTKTDFAVKDSLLTKLQYLQSLNWSPLGPVENTFESNSKIVNNNPDVKPPHPDLCQNRFRKEPFLVTDMHIPLLFTGVAEFFLTLFLPLMSSDLTEAKSIVGHQGHVPHPEPFFEIMRHITAVHAKRYLLKIQDTVGLRTATHEGRHSLDGMTRKHILKAVKLLQEDNPPPWTSSLSESVCLLMGFSSECCCSMKLISLLKSSVSFIPVMQSLTPSSITRQQAITVSYHLRKIPNSHVILPVSVFLSALVNWSRYTITAAMLSYGWEKELTDPAPRVSAPTCVV